MRIATPFVVAALFPFATAWSQASPTQLRRALNSIRPADTLAKATTLASDEMEGRNAGYAGCWKAADWIAGEFGRLGLRPAGDSDTYFQTFTFQARGRDGGSDQPQAENGGENGADGKGPHHETPTTRNVLALIEGRDPKRKDEVVIIGAHYDHVGREGQWNGPSRRGRPKGGDDIWNGADDNASGSAVVLEVAEALASAEIRPRRSVLFVLFSAEEHGLFGSKWYCEHPVIPLDKTVAMLNLDMVGYQKSDTLQIGGVDHASDRALRNAFNAAHRQLRGLTIKLEPWAGKGNSDHAPFIGKGVPAVFLFNGLNNDYHTVEDEVSALSGPRMAGVAQLVLLAALELCDLDEKPRFVPASTGPTGIAAFGLKGASPVDDARAKELRLRKTQGGLLVRAVVPDTPAADAGLENEDVILGIGRYRVERGNETGSLEEILAKLKPGSAFTVKVIRGRRSKTLRAKLPK